MSNLKRNALMAGFVLTNLLVGAQRLAADNLIHTAAYDPQQDKWIVVCTMCVIACNCSENQT